MSREGIGEKDAGPSRRFQLQHEHWTDARLRSLVNRHLSSGVQGEELKLYWRLKGEWWLRFQRHAGPDIAAVLQYWLDLDLSGIRQERRDYLEEAERRGISRATVFRWIDRFLRACSFWMIEGDLHVECEQTHGSSGGNGGTPPTGRREHSAGACPTCALLAGATWDGWTER